MERDILQKLRARDEDGLKAFLKQYKGLVNYIINGILKDERDREECLNDVCMKIWNGIDSFDEDKGSFNVWLTAVSRNTALSILKRVKTEEELDEEYGEYSMSPEYVYLERERERELHRLIEKLAKTDRDLFWRKYYYMQSTKKISDEMDMSERAVEGHLYRIKKKLRKLGGEL